MPALRTTKAEIKRLTTNPSTKQIIDGLWRAPLWMHDEVLLSPDDEAKTEAGASFDARYVYAENSFLDADDNQVSFASAEGFGNSMQASFAHVIGHFNAATSFAETIIGFHGFVSETQNAHQWIVTDRLFTIANGADANNRSDAFHMYKSGYAVYENAVGIGEYMHGSREPLDGTIQFNGAFSGYYNEAWHTFATAEQLSGLHPAVTIDPNSSTELYLYDGQIIGIDLSAYAKTENIHPPVSLGTGSETELALNPTTQVLTLTGLKKTFLSLNDTPSAYPTNGYGQGLKASGSNVLFSDSFGSDEDGFWMKIIQGNETNSEHRYVDLGDYQSFILGAGWSRISGSNYHHTSGGGLLVSNSVHLNIIENEIEDETVYYFYAYCDAPVNIYLVTPTGNILLRSNVTGGCNSTFTVSQNGSYAIAIEPYTTSTVVTISDFNLSYTYYWNTPVFSSVPRLVDNTHAVLLNYPKPGGAAGDISCLDTDGVTMIFKPLEDIITDANFLLDTDFPTAGLMLTDGAGNYSVITDNSANWNTALVDADFASNGIMVRTGAGTYSTIADNSATWNTLASLGTKTFWNGTQAAYDAIGTKDSNTIYFINV